MGRDSVPTLKSTFKLTFTLGISTDLIFWNGLNIWGNAERNLWGSKETRFRNENFFVEEPVFHSKIHVLLDLPSYHLNNLNENFDNIFFF